MSVLLSNAYFFQIICAICMGFIYDPAKTTGLGQTHMDHVGVMYTAYTGFMLINTILLISRCLKDRIPYKTATMFSVSGSCIFLITGILLLVGRAQLFRHYFYHPQMYLLTMMTTSIIFAFVNAAVFAVDAVFTFRRQEDFWLVQSVCVLCVQLG